jgi:hypothetical protein
MVCHGVSSSTECLPPWSVVCHCVSWCVMVCPARVSAAGRASRDARDGLTSSSGGGDDARSSRRTNAVRSRVDFVNASDGKLNDVPHQEFEVLGLPSVTILSGLAERQRTSPLVACACVRLVLCVCLCTWSEVSASSGGLSSYSGLPSSDATSALMWPAGIAIPLRQAP